MADFDDQLAIAADARGFSDPFGGAVEGTSLEIRQVEGANPLTVLLRGRAMPYRAPSWPVEQHSKLTWYPGNPVATQQVLGPREQETTFSGKWKARFIQGSILINGDPSVIDTPAAAVQLFEQLARSGKRVRVQWAFEVRLGLLKTFTPSPDRIQDIAWEAEFEWSARNDETAPRAATEQSAPAGNDVFKAQNALEDTHALAPPNAIQLAASLLAEIDDIGDRVADVVDNLKQVEALVNLPAQTLGALRSNVAQLTRQLSEFQRRILGERSSAQDADTSARTKGATTSPTSGGGHRTGAARASSSDVQELQLEVWRRTMGRNAGNLRFQVQRLLLDAENRLQPQATRIYTARQGDNLYALATRFYGSPDFANFLAQANRLTTVVVPGGYLLRVPPRPVGGVAQVEIVTDRQPPVGSGDCC